MLYSVEKHVFIVLEYHQLNHTPTLSGKLFQPRFQVTDGKTLLVQFKKFQPTANMASDLVENVGPI